MKSNLKIVEHNLPAHWASYLINGDDSGIESADVYHADKFLAERNLPMPVSCSDESWFAAIHDAYYLTQLSGDVMTFTFLVPVPAESGVAK